MPWKECKAMDERVKFIGRYLTGEKIAPLCREFGISRKTGHKIIDRYKDTGLQGLSDRSRRPYRHANQLPYQVECSILALKQEYPEWGAPPPAALFSGNVILVDIKPDEVVGLERWNAANDNAELVLIAA